MMLGFLLARAGIGVTVLEKHGDFLRDFRGDTIHPSTLELMHQLGLDRAFLQLPHQEMAQIDLSLNAKPVPVADFSRLPVHHRFVAFMPQWDFLNFIADQARQFPNFRLLMQTEMTDLIWQHNRVVGVRATTPTGALTIEADLVVGTDGRRSRVRERAGLSVRDFQVPIDVLWMRIPKDPSQTDQALFYINQGRVMVLIDRHDYFQCGYLIPKGQFDTIKQQGLPALQDAILRLAPFVGESVRTLTNWDQISLLTVKIDRLRRWYKPGLLCIGDAAHAMSPAGGVGVNMAIQDAVAAARHLAEPLKQGTVELAVCHRVQRRRLFPVRLVQAVQIVVHKRIINGQTATIPTGVVWLLRHVPAVRRFIGRMIGLGPRPEPITG